jgi:uncharacterized protein (DUF983 family)
MSALHYSDRHYEVADCPQCGKRDFIDKTDTQWTCLNCGFSKDVSQPEEGKDPVNIWLILVLGVLVTLVALSL